MQAAVLWEPRCPVEILEVELAPPRAREVLVKIAASGICASDLHVVDGTLPEPIRSSSGMRPPAWSSRRDRG